MSHNLIIKKNAGGEWIVSQDGEKSMIKPGEDVFWQIDPGEIATAHLQFLEDLFEPSGDLDTHWVGTLKAGESLKLRLASKALPDPNVIRRTCGYAVAVVDDDGMHYAIGHNPPPDLDVGN